MSSQSSRFPRLIAIGAAAGALAIGAVAATGCGSDDENADSVNSVIDSVQSQASSVQSQASSVSSQAQEQALSVQSQAQEQAKSIQEQIQSVQTQSNGGSAPGY